MHRPDYNECKIAVNLLEKLHGKPIKQESNKLSVLDSLIRTILSQNTTDKNSSIAFRNLKTKFNQWKDVLEADNITVEDSIRFGGLAEIKTKRIKTILQSIISNYEDKCERQEPSLEFLHDYSTDEIVKILNSFPGVGPKTISCVLMFSLNRPDFPVDTHVWFIAKKLGWVPQSCSRESCYEILNNRIPNELKYSLHILLVEHGKRCRNCSKGGKLQLPEEGICPFINWNNTIKIKLEEDNSNIREIPIEGCEMIKAESKSNSKKRKIITSQVNIAESKECD